MRNVLLAVCVFVAAHMLVATSKAISEDDASSTVMRCTLSRPVGFIQCHAETASSVKVRNCKVFVSDTLQDGKYLLLFENNTGRGLRETELSFWLDGRKLTSDPVKLPLIGPGGRVCLEIVPNAAAKKAFERWVERGGLHPETDSGKVVYEVISFK